MRYCFQSQRGATTTPTIKSTGAMSRNNVKPKNEKKKTATTANAAIRLHEPRTVLDATPSNSS